MCEQSVYFGPSQSEGVHSVLHKVDWASVEPGGRATKFSKNYLLRWTSAWGT